MRNQLLHGYVIHARKYREKSHIVHLFSQEYGRIDGILRQTPPPQYQPIRCYATGKHALKNFSQLEYAQAPVFLAGDSFFLGFYLNEILLKLAPIEQEMPDSFVQYQSSIQYLQQHTPHQQQTMLQMLREFEHALLLDLGYLPDFSVDAQQQPIQQDSHYHYHLNEGFLLASQGKYQGTEIMAMLNYQQGCGEIPLKFLTSLYRQIINQLLGDKPLKSRQLWQKRHAG